ncbi:putative RNA methyltransferase [Macleaya cordata]|uniref:Putative RNA methyltransferase n=1 Tax=Macleaya cordata TaxID=56857 RepID=A0A200Q887_MACCD|nr:putative RNA methyltransferase [Macleaya cordata]
MAKKRRAESEVGVAEKKEEAVEGLVNGETKREKSKREKSKREKKEIPTVTIALPGSIIDNTQSYELATRLAGQIARAATIFRIDEVVVFDNKSGAEDDSSVTTAEDADGNESGSQFLIRILKYLETPQYLRRALFPMHNSLRYVGLLPPLDAPHHLRKHEWGPYREGVTLKVEDSNFVGTLVDVGLNKNIFVDQKLEPGIRVTVAMGTNRCLETDSFRKVVPSSTPREEVGSYWGYKVRYAPNISSVFKDCPYEGGYDHKVGTSEHGLVVNSSEHTIPTFRHLLIAFGGLAGLEESIEEDSNLKGKDAREVFDSYLNTCPHQGSRTIRTEEAIFISLQYFQEPISRAVSGI